MNIFGYEVFGGSSQNKTIFRGHFYALLGLFLGVLETLFFKGGG